MFDMYTLSSLQIDGPCSNYTLNKDWNWESKDGHAAIYDIIIEIQGKNTKTFSVVVCTKS